MCIPFLRAKAKMDFFSRVIIRLVSRDDLMALEWEGEFSHFRKLYSEAFQRSVNGLTLMWLAELPDIGVIGQVFIQLDCPRPELANGIDHAYLYAFRIRPAYRNLGLGTQMLYFVQNDLFSRGFKYLTLNVGKDNPRARRLYERQGFRVRDNEAGVWSYEDHQGNWQHVNEPAWRMEKPLRSRIQTRLSNKC